MVEGLREVRRFIPRHGHGFCIEETTAANNMLRMFMLEMQLASLPGGRSDSTPFSPTSSVGSPSTRRLEHQRDEANPLAGTLLRGVQERTLELRVGFGG